MNSRTKGHNFERAMAEVLREVWPDCYTTRFKGTLWQDHCGIDLVGTQGYNVQLKAMERTPAYHDILDYMPKGENVNIVIHKRNRKGSVVVMKLEDFMRVMLSKHTPEAGNTLK